MLNRKPSFNKTIETEQLRLLSEAEGLGTDDPQYAVKIDHMKSLNEVKSKKDNTTIITALIGAFASLAGIGAVLNYEKVGAVVSKSFGLVRKP